jgi:hypothetical protein
MAMPDSDPFNGDQLLAFPPPLNAGIGEEGTHTSPDFACSPLVVFYSHTGEPSRGERSKVGLRLNLA